MSPDLLFNMWDDNDIILSGSYQVATNKEVRRGYPLKESGSLGGGGNRPPNTIYRQVEEYTDTNSLEPCIGLSERQIPKNTGTLAEALRNIEFRGFNRDVDIVQFGVRKCINKDPDETTMNTGAKLAPYPGGFRKWATGMAELGTVKQGPIAYNKDGYIAVKIEYTQS